MSDLVRVCEDWFPKGSYKGQKKDGFAFDSKLKQQIDIAVKNVINDWDFTIIISGGGEVRVGKSVLMLQICCYWCYAVWKQHNIDVHFELKDNIVFNWDKLIEKGNFLGEKGKYSTLAYDEAGETMEGTKTASRELRAVRDYLRECGQYNFLNILVMPEFFDLPKGIAITRSTFLIDVYYTATEEGLFKRGMFRFYSRKNKKQLYLKGKKELNYNAHTFNFSGEFVNFYPVDEKEYRETKKIALRGRGALKDKKMEQRDIAWHYLYNQVGLNYIKIGEIYRKFLGYPIHESTIRSAVDSVKEDYGNIGIKGK